MPNSPSRTPKQYLKQRFGIPERYLDNKEFVKRTGDIWLNSVKSKDERIEYQTEGIRFLRINKHGYKPTTYALQILQDQVNKSLVEVNREQFQKLLNREMIKHKDKSKEEGYVAIKHQKRVIGCGLYKDELVSSRIPKGRSKELKKAIEKHPEARN